MRISKEGITDLRTRKWNQCLVIGKRRQKRRDLRENEYI